ncbi:murein hydrolase activator EnvC family protein [Segetibacter koreensis]|uniref:murein hydrolase activator EnvC family protein n=1 Tax=Segetibacter koreensis TaxID=398037 RepID=UPI0003613480|nr:peptidoglycan DD-metalloendopeptidase family protein [Segetibacter koreensis]
MIKRIIFLFLFTSFASCLFAQETKEELQRKQQDLLKEIRDLNQTLKNIRSSKNKSLANYNLVKRKIAAREELIQNINKDMRLLDKNISLNTQEIDRLKKQLDTLKQEYSKSLVFAYKNRSSYDYLNFIFSAATFNDAVKRVTYLRSYRLYREQQVDNILKTQELISHKIATLNNSKNEKNLALQDQNKQLTDLEEDKKEQNNEVNKLKSQEKDLAAQIKKRENDRRQMQSAISAIIRRELAEARKKAEAVARAKRAAEEERKRKLAEQRRLEKLQQQKEQPSVASNTTPEKPSPEATAPAEEEAVTGVATGKPKTDRVYSDLESTDEGRAQSINFESGRGRLPWPVDAGIPTIHFGSYTIPGTVLKGKSDGLYISVPVGASVKAIADGEVSSVYDLGGEQAVTVRHGKYFTTYSHLASVNVNQNQQVRPGTVVGHAAANDAGEGEVLFMVINDKSVFLNPEQWLKKK